MTAAYERPQQLGILGGRLDDARADERAALRVTAEDALSWLRDYRFLVAQHSPGDLPAHDALIARLADATEAKPAAVAAAEAAFRAELYGGGAERAA
ncbi:MAG: hypothetical protein RIB84_22420 [Sneathiellaceae bacterium]